MSRAGPDTIAGCSVADGSRLSEVKVAGGWAWVGPVVLAHPTRPGKFACVRFDGRAGEVRQGRRMAAATPSGVRYVVGSRWTTLARAVALLGDP